MGKNNRYNHSRSHYQYRRQTGRYNGASGYNDMYENPRNRNYDRDDARYEYHHSRQDEYDDFADTTTGRLVSKMTKEKSPKQKTVKCNNVKYDSCCKQGVYKNLRTGEVTVC